MKRLRHVNVIPPVPLRDVNSALLYKCHTKVIFRVISVRVKIAISLHINQRSRLGEAVGTPPDEQRQVVSVKVEDGGVRVGFCELGGFKSDAAVEVYNFGAEEDHGVCDVRITNLGGFFDGGDVDNDEVAGAVVVELSKR